MQGDEILRLQTSTQQEGTTRETIFGTFRSENVPIARLHPLLHGRPPVITGNDPDAADVYISKACSLAQTLNLLRDRLFVELESVPVVGLHQSLDPTRFL
jgi:hypothetical protein